MYPRRLPFDVSWRMDLLRRRTARRPPQPRSVRAAARRGTWRRTWHFPTRSAAERWNAEWEAFLARPGAGHPALVRIGGTAIGDPLLDVLARLAGNVIKEEALRGAPYPFMRVGRTYTLRIRLTPYRSRRPGSEPKLIFTVRSEVLDPQSELIWAGDATRQYPADLVPTGIVELWCRRPWKPTDEIYA